MEEQITTAKKQKFKLDLKYEPYKLVGGLDFTKYNDNVTEVYDDTVTTYTSCVINQKLDSTQSDRKLTIMRA